MDNTPIRQTNPNQQQRDVILSQLYAKKGELVTQIELLQGELKQINQQLSQILSVPVRPPQQTNEQDSSGNAGDNSKKKGTPLKEVEN